MNNAQPLLGGISALATSLLWSLSATAWGFAGRHISSLSIAAIRILLASVMMVGIHWAIFGSPWPANLEWESTVLLVGSGFFGMAAGDMFAFRGIVLLGPRLYTLVFSVCPIITTVIAWASQGEALTARACAGVAVIVGGVAWVVSEPHGRRSWAASPRHLRQGLACTLVSTLLTAVSYILTRMGLGGGSLGWSGRILPAVDPFQATLIRVVTGMFVTWAALPLFSQFRPTLAGMRNRRAMPFLVVGTIVGPVVGVWMSMIAFARLPSGIASALIGSGPIFMIPISAIAFGEKHSPRCLLGTALVVGGVFLLLL
jgi:drug/metabolite transporter (DMT)-like permease